MKKQSSDYLEQYKNPKWQKLRLKILERDRWVCQKCGEDESQLQVHHRRYIFGKKVWEYNKDDLVTLCKECHENEKEGMKEEIGKFTEILRRKLFSSHISDLHCSLGYLLHQEEHPADCLISAISWMLSFNLEAGILEPYRKHLEERGV